MIRQATKKDLTGITKLIHAVIMNMQEQGSSQWDETYPAEENYLRDIARSELYVYQDHGKLIGVFTLSSQGHEEYDSIVWKSEKPAWTIKRLAVDPEHYGQGIADQLIDHAENLAILSGIYRLNTDTYSDNEHANKLFQRHAFQVVDQQADPRTEERLFYYEKILTKKGQ